MDAEVMLGYGNEQVKVEIKGAQSVETILPREMTEITDLPAAFLHAVEDGAIGSAPLKEMVSASDPVTIVVS
ncbi:hypothetical protein VSS86_21825, partial [Bacillus safensis]